MRFRSSTRPRSRVSLKWSLGMSAKIDIVLSFQTWCNRIAFYFMKMIRNYLQWKPVVYIHLIQTQNNFSPSWSLTLNLNKHFLLQVISNYQNYFQMPKLFSNNHLGGMRTLSIRKTHLPPRFTVTSWQMFWDVASIFFHIQKMQNFPVGKQPR